MKDSTLEEKKVAKKKEDEKEKKEEQQEEEIIEEESAIKKGALLIGKYLWEKIKDYKYVIALDLVVFILLFFFIPVIIFKVKPWIWTIAFILFCMIPTIGLYALKKFRDKQIMFGFFWIYLLILIFIKRFTLIDLYGITSHGTLDHTPAWLDAVFVTCVIVFFEYIGMLFVDFYYKYANSRNKKLKKAEK